MSEADPVVAPATMYQRTLFVQGGYSVDQLTPVDPFTEMLVEHPARRFRGHGILNPGTLKAVPFEFEIEAKTLTEAFEEFEAAMKKGVENLIEQANAAQKKIQLAGAGPINDFRAERARRELDKRRGGNNKRRRF